MPFSFLVGFGVCWFQLVALWLSEGARASSVCMLLAPSEKLVHVHAFLSNLPFPKKNQYICRSFLKTLRALKKTSEFAWLLGRTPRSLTTTNEKGNRCATRVHFVRGVPCFGALNPSASGAEKDHETNLQMVAAERAKYFRAVKRLFSQLLGETWRVDPIF